MCTLRIGVRPGMMLDRGLVGLIRELRPLCQVEVGHGPPDLQRGCITVRMADVDRWLALILDRDDFEASAAALVAGASIIIPLGAELEELDGGLAALAEGGPFLIANLARRMATGALARSTRFEAAVPLSRLTKREAEVLGLVATGLTNQEIALDLSVSVHTVRSHLQSLGAKLHATSRAKLIASAWEAGVSSPTHVRRSAAG